jgi:hypothetical protein
LNIQIVSDYVTITFYKKESSNSIIRRELIPTHSVQHIWVKDLLLSDQSGGRKKDMGSGIADSELQKEDGELEQISLAPDQIVEEKEKKHMRSSQI